MITNETETVDRTEEPPEEIDQDDPIGTDGYVIMTGRFPTIGLGLLQFNGHFE